MSLSRSILALLRKPATVVTSAAILVLAALATVPLTAAAPPNPTAAPDILFDGGRMESQHYDGAYLGDVNPASPASAKVDVAYDLTVNNLTTNATSGRLRSPDGMIVIATASLYNDGDNPGKRAVTFAAVSAQSAGIYSLIDEATSAVLGAVYFGPLDELDVLVSPDPVTYSPSGMIVTYSVSGPAGPAANARVVGPFIPANASTNGSGDLTTFQSGPSPGTHVVIATKQLMIVSTNGVDVPERSGLGAYNVVATNASQLTQSGLQVPDTGIVGQPIVVHVTVSNGGNSSSSGTLALRVNGIERETRNVTLAGGESGLVNFSFTPTVAGTYAVSTTLGNSTLGPETVLVSAAAAPVDFSIGTFNGGILAPVQAPILMRNVTDFGAATVTLEIDTSAVTVQNVSAGNLSDASTTWSFNASSGKLTLLVTTTARPGATGDFVLAHVVLSAVGPAGSTSALDLEVLEAVGSDGAGLASTATDGSFRAGLLGDADGDGDVDAQDVLAIADAVVGKRPMSSIVIADADVSRDGAVTGRDAMFLRQHLAGTRPTL